MHVMRLKPTHKFKLRIKSKNKSYTFKDSGLYNLTTKKLLENRLQKSVCELRSLADDSNYRVFFEEKPDGKKREIQAPTLGLDVVQTRIASLLVRVSTPDYLHSGVKKRSNITNAKVHVGDHPVLAMDIKKFYPSVSKKAIYHFFHNTMKSAPDVAGILANLCTYKDHIPTGSRISMPLAFWANHTMFNELQSLCDSQGVAMSIYVDDLTFSGRSVNTLFAHKVKRIVSASGLTIHPDKSRLYRHDEPKLITGVVIVGNFTKLRNKHHKAIYNLFNEMKVAGSDEQLDAIYEKLLGRLSAAGQVESEFKMKAKALLAQSKR